MPRAIKNTELHEKRVNANLRSVRNSSDNLLRLERLHKPIRISGPRGDRLVSYKRLYAPIEIPAQESCIREEDWLRMLYTTVEIDGKTTSFYDTVFRKED